MEYVDYYKVLGVDRNATQEEIGKAYKKKAREFHPDLNKDPGAEEKFKQVNEAHEVLKDPQTRKRFDTLGANWKHGAPFTPPPGFSGFGGDGVRFEFRQGDGGSGFSDFFETVFGGRGRGGARTTGGRPGGINLEDILGGMGGMGGMGGGGGGPFAGGGFGRQAGPQRGSDVESELEIGLEDAYHGNTMTVTLAGPSGRRRYDVKIPRGVGNGAKIRLAGQGVEGEAGKGDLYLKIRLRPHPTFKLEGKRDLVTEVAVPAWDAALGARIPVPTLEGTVTMTLPPGLSSGQRLRIKGRGMPDRKGNHGDLYAELRVEVPDRLTDEQRELFEKLRDLA